MHRYLIIFLITFLLISPVCAETIITVDEKRVEGTGDAPLFVIGQLMTSSKGISFLEYPISADDYEKVNYDTVVTLERGSDNLYKVVKVGK